MTTQDPPRGVQGMTREGQLHPADEKALCDLFALARKVAARLAPGRRTEVVIERLRGEGRLTGRVLETHYPLEEAVRE